MQRKKKQNKELIPHPDPTAPALLAAVEPTLPEGVVGKSRDVSSYELAVIRRVMRGDSIEKAYLKAVEPGATKAVARMRGHALFNRSEVYDTYRRLMLSKVAARMAKIALGEAEFRVVTGFGDKKQVHIVSAKPMEQIAAAKQVEEMLGFKKEIEMMGKVIDAGKVRDETDSMILRAMKSDKDITPVDVCETSDDAV